MIKPPASPSGLDAREDPDQPDPPAWDRAGFLKPDNVASASHFREAVAGMQAWIDRADGNPLVLEARWSQLRWALRTHDAALLRAVALPALLDPRMRGREAEIASALVASAASTCDADPAWLRAADRSLRRHYLRTCQP